MGNGGTSDFDVGALLKLVAERSGERIDGLPAEIVRFTLEYRKEPALPAARLQLENILSSSNFDLQVLDPDAGRFLVLQFPGVARTIAPPRLFAAGDFLANRLDLVSCVPDIGTTLYSEPDARILHDGAPESVITDAFCWSSASPPPDKRWAVKIIKSDTAWSMSGGKGEGIYVAQPDTGIAQHPEVDVDALALDRALNVLNGSRDPTDPLKEGTANPGHGTATSSAVISREAGMIAGAAPAAKLIPIRCIEDVKIFDGAPVARAILHAASVKADVISLSLGGIYSPSIAAALEKALADGCIVVAASGNCVGFVVYPASDHKAIALAGTDSFDRPWKGTSRGPQIDVSAPAENVFVARRTPGDGGNGIVAGGQGTSFATALTAGVAATWISHFGRVEVRAEALRRTISVQELFRAALKASARRPTGWNSWLYGAGIVDAAALLSLELKNIPAPGPANESVVQTQLSEAEQDVAAVFRSSASRSSTDGFDWAKYGAEATFLAADEYRRSDPTKAGLVESRLRPQPSPGLMVNAPAVIERVLTRARNAPELIEPLGAMAESRDVVKILGRRRGESESSGPSSKTHLLGEGVKDVQAAAEKVFSGLNAQPEATSSAISARKAVLESSERVIKEYLKNGRSGIAGIDLVNLEALVLLKGRPALKVTEGKIDEKGLKGSDWEGVFTIAPDQLKSLSERVGRIDIDGAHVGTGFVVADGLVMTNRHVAEAIADQIRGARGNPVWILQKDVSVNFDDLGQGDKKRFKIKSIAATGSDVIGRGVDFAHLDLALLEAETSNGFCKFPQAGQLCGRPEVAQTKLDVVVMGYPARPDMSAIEDPNMHLTRDDVARRLAEIFGLDFGRKYLAPGRIDTVAGKVAGDTSSWIFTHDSTTLGGNSGSCVSQLTDHLPVVGLHFAGRTLTANYAHSLSAVRTSDRLSKELIDRMRWA